MFNLTTKAYIAVTESIRRFKENEKGVTAIEYGLIAVVMAALVVAVFYGNDSFIGKIVEKFKALTSSVETAVPQLK
ncbi:Flp family type IVb pilin [Frederiksenia canicola]|uniref:Fimbrial protein n=1 Tax=Frederiksenia canicola TaxID=123824 RepID=A0AAE6X4A5_9PAST|nr:Flp family type IVb pilin [Frederiksenia canicola]QIM63972.1 fimbrial protein [Frederiksenia canicola]RPE95706.1 pilus assembly protein Flp/PilA [Frederiksenia canicola]